MCKSKAAASASDPGNCNSSATRSPRPCPQSATFGNSYTSSRHSVAGTSTSSYTSTSSNVSSKASLSSVKDSLSKGPQIYDVSEIRAVTNNFLAKRFSATSCWRCNLTKSDVIIFQREFHRRTETPVFKELLSIICRSHHKSFARLLGASVSEDQIYLVYEFVNGPNLANSLRNSHNPRFTVLSTWMSRMQVAADLADGLDYIHNKTGLSVNLVHNHIKSSSIVVTEPSFNAKICHFGTAQLCGETDELDSETKMEVKLENASRSGRTKKFKGVRGYMSPEFQLSGMPTQKSDVYAFGVVLLELISGEEPMKYRYDKRRRDFVRTSVVETARTAMEEDEGGGGKEMRLRMWIDRRLKDSFPMDVVLKLTELALHSTHQDPNERPDMSHVASKVSKLYLESKHWSDNIGIAKDISVSLAPR